VSWLLVALIPGLLMLATLGLERVEAGLRREAFPSADVDELLQHAEAVEAETRARAASGRTPRAVLRRVTPRDTPTDGFLEPVSAPGPPTGEYFRVLANTEFRQTRHADRV
jgi:hypothetical protein